jgi:hypothetical protein
LFFQYLLLSLPCNQNNKNMTDQRFLYIKDLATQIAELKPHEQFILEQLLDLLHKGYKQGKKETQNEPEHEQFDTAGFQRSMAVRILQS